MKTFHAPFTSLMGLFSFAAIAMGKPPTFAGGDGSSVEKAVIVNAANEEEGVRAEYQYIAKHFPGSKTGTQGVMNAKGKVYDRIEFKTSDGKSKEIYFDITAFFGK